MSELSLPVVTDDFDGQTAAIDQAIRETAIAFGFSFSGDAPKFQDIYHVPELVYKLIQHYTMRGFLCEYDGDEGKLKISWSHPNMSWLEHREITRAIPEMIPNLGISFRAGILYLCMTNGEDLREHSDATLISQLEKGIKSAATLGNTSLTFGFPEVPAPVVQNLFKETFDKLFDVGFIVTFNVNANIFVLNWGHTLTPPMTDGTLFDLSID